MSKRKDAVSLNVYVSRDVAGRLEEYCRLTGRTKTIVTEWALDRYLEEQGAGIGGGSGMEVRHDA